MCPCLAVALMRLTYVCVCCSPGFFFFESIDMLRKLLLLGALAITKPGSSFQIGAGLSFSFMFFAAHIR
jgi:hypothetical protein